MPLAPRPPNFLPPTHGRCMLHRSDGLAMPGCPCVARGAPTRVLSCLQFCTEYDARDGLRCIRVTALTFYARQLGRNIQGGHSCSKRHCGTRHQ